jgi:hypothetical protein
VRRNWLVLALVIAATGCRAGGCVLATLGDIVGATGDARCDRRFVADDRNPAPFCQEIIDTLARSQFQNDCREKHAAQAGEGRCPREDLLGGCKLHKQNDDGSDVWDWFYDVTALEEDAGIEFDRPARTADEVRALCADRGRYEEGATFFEP